MGTEDSLFYQIDTFQIKVDEDLAPFMIEAVFQGIRDLDGEKLIVGGNFVDHLRSQIGDQVHLSFKGSFMRREVDHLRPDDQDDLITLVKAIISMERHGFSPNINLYFPSVLLKHFSRQKIRLLSYEIGHKPRFRPGIDLFRGPHLS